MDNFNPKERYIDLDTQLEIDDSRESVLTFDDVLSNVGIGKY